MKKITSIYNKDKKLYDYIVTKNESKYYFEVIDYRFKETMHFLPIIVSLENIKKFINHSIDTSKYIYKDCKIINSLLQ